MGAVSAAPDTHHVKVYDMHLFNRIGARLDVDLSTVEVATVRRKWTNLKSGVHGKSRGEFRRADSATRWSERMGMRDGRERRGRRWEMEETR
jgi:hypothetical protein